MPVQEMGAPGPLLLPGINPAAILPVPTWFRQHFRREPVPLSGENQVP